MTLLLSDKQVSELAPQDVARGYNELSGTTRNLRPLIGAALLVSFILSIYCVIMVYLGPTPESRVGPPPASHPAVSRSPPPPNRNRKNKKWTLATGSNPNLTAITAAALSTCKVCANAPPLLNASVGWWTPAIAAAEAEAKAAVAAATAAAIAAAAAAVRDAVPLNATAIMREGRIPVAQRLRVRWADGLHLGAVASHKLEDAPGPGAVRALLHCITYDTGFQACSNLEAMKKQCEITRTPSDPLASAHLTSHITFTSCSPTSADEIVQPGVFEAAPPVASPPPPPPLPSPPPPHGPRSLLPSCCHHGGSWSGQCGPRSLGGTTWHMGLRGCNLRECSKCGAVRLSTGRVDLNCCNSGGSWAGVCGQPALGFAFSWKEGYRACNSVGMNSRSNGGRRRGQHATRGKASTTRLDVVSGRPSLAPGPRRTEVGHHNRTASRPRKRRNPGDDPWRSSQVR